MQRCAPRAAAFAAALALASSLTLPAWAQMQRRFPANALRGEAVFHPAPGIQINGQAAQLAPGARIRNTDNLIVMPASLVGGKAEVHYTVDNLGMVKDVWILTTEERAKQPWPKTAQEAATWVFNPDGQSWSKR